MKSFSYVPQLFCSRGPALTQLEQQSELFCPSHRCSGPQQASVPCEWHSPQCWLLSVTVKYDEASLSSPGLTTNLSEHKKKAYKSYFSSKFNSLSALKAMPSIEAVSLIYPCLCFVTLTT